MYVNGTGPAGPRGPEGANGSRPVDGSGAPHNGTDVRHNGFERGQEVVQDRVEISDEARAMAEAESAPETEQTGLLPQLVVRMRARMAQGYYDRPEVMAETALKILQSGDLQGS